MMQHCKSKNRNSGDLIMLGNTYEEFTSKQEDFIKSFIKQYHKILLPDDNIEENEDNLVDWFAGLAGELLGYSEYYRCRVMESCIVVYSDKDIYVEEIKF